MDKLVRKNKILFADEKIIGKLQQWIVGEFLRVKTVGRIGVCCRWLRSRTTTATSTLTSFCSGAETIGLWRRRRLRSGWFHRWDRVLSGCSNSGWPENRIRFAGRIWDSRVQPQWLCARHRLRRESVQQDHCYCSREIIGCVFAVLCVQKVFYVQKVWIYRVDA